MFSLNYRSQILGRAYVVLGDSLNINMCHLLSIGETRLKLYIFKLTKSFSSKDRPRDFQEICWWLGRMEPLVSAILAWATSLSFRSKLHPSLPISFWHLFSLLDLECLYLYQLWMKHSGATNISCVHLHFSTLAFRMQTTKFRSMNHK